MNRSVGYVFCVLALGGMLGCDKQPPPPGPADVAPAAPPPVAAPAAAAPTRFTPPAESDIPQNEYGEMVLLGKNIFVNTQQHAKAYVGNGMNCANCHLDNGRKADSAPLWAAYVLYPAYRQKTRQVDTIQSRIQGCFLYSMNGKAPALDSKEMTALVTYHYWLAKGAPTGVKLPGQGYVKVPKPAQTPDLARGRGVYENNCAICHGANGEGIKARGEYAFPPLWGKDSFNWGAGMHRVDTAAGFIQANMPYGLGGSLSDQEAWDVALFMSARRIRALKAASRRRVTPITTRTACMGAPPRRWRRPSSERPKPRTRLLPSRQPNKRKVIPRRSRTNSHDYAPGAPGT